MNKILIAEDHEDFRALLVHVVREIFPTADIWTAKDGLEAWKKFRSWDADMVVTDFRMPNMKGDALAINIRKIHQKDIPIILISSEPKDCEQRDMFTAVCYKDDFDDFKEVLKGFRPIGGQ